MRTRTRVLAGSAAVTLATLGLTPAALAAESPEWAKVTRWAPGTGNNQVSDWCTTGYKIEEPGGTTWVIGASLTVPGTPTRVVVKAGSDASTQFANTVFEEATLALGQVVWADTNGNKIHDPGRKDGDKDISHVIVCVDPAPIDPPDTPPVDPNPPIDPPNPPVDPPNPPDTPTNPPDTPTNPPVTPPTPPVDPPTPPVNPPAPPVTPPTETPVGPPTETPVGPPAENPGIPPVDEGQTEGDGVVDGTEDDDVNASVKDDELAHTGASLAAAVVGGSLLTGGAALSGIARRRKA